MVVIPHVVLPFLFGGEATSKPTLEATSKPTLEALVHRRKMMILLVLQHSFSVAEGLKTHVALN
jgi:hypothetical protein